MNDQPTTESQDERWGFFFEVCAYLTFFITCAAAVIHFCGLWNT